MSTTIHSPDDVVTVCPETGLPITSRPEWTHRRFGNDFWLTSRVIGDRIILNQPSGYAELEGLIESLKMTDTVIRSSIDSSTGYVHISDYSGMRGVSREARKYYIRYVQQREHLLGIAYFGVSPLFRIMINMAKRFSWVKCNVRITRDYATAISAAAQLLGGEPQLAAAEPRPRKQWAAGITEHFESGHHVLRCDRWRLALDGYTLTVEVIDRRIYHAISTGRMEAHHIAPVDRLRERVRQMLGFDVGFPVIMTATTGGQRSDRRVRTRYMDALKRWHARYPVKLYILYDANWSARTAAMLASSFMPFRVKTVSGIDAALAMADRVVGLAPVASPSALSTPDIRADHSVPEVRQLLQFIGDIDWEHNGVTLPDHVDAAHPFRPVFDAIALIKGELDEVLQAHHQAEAALRESQQRFEEVLRHSRDILFKRNLRQGTYDYVSDSVQDLLGISPKEIYEMGFSGVQALVHPDDRIRFTALNSQLMTCSDEACAGIGSLYRVRGKQGNYLWFSDKRAIVRDSDGRPVSVLGNLREITEQKLAEEERRSSHERLTTVLDSITAHIYVSDLQTFEILFMNRAMHDVFGDYPAGSRCFEFFRHASKACDGCIVDKLVDGQGHPTGVHIWEGQHPVKKCWYLNHDQAIRWVDGRMVRVQIAMDISRLKSLERERLEIAEQLRQTLKLEAVSTLAGGVAHNFNNLLMVVLGNLELLRMDMGENSDQLRRIDAAEKSATKAADLSSLMLTYVGQTKINPQPLDLNATLKKMVDLINTTVADSASLTLDINDGPTWIHADSAKVYQVITNLVTNAVEASGDQPLEIRLSVGAQYCDTAQLSRLAPGDRLPEGRYIWLRVSDNGRGMDPETLEKVFDPFFTTKFTGRGLGMAAVMGIMRAHRGGVRIDSRPDAGTAVTVYFPERKAVAALAPKAPPVDAATRRKQRGTALLVDDEPLVLELGSQMLQLLGFDVITATDGVEALAKANAERINIVLLDINMPRMGGRETLERLRAMGATFPVLVTSGFTEFQVREKLGDVQVDGYINKPFRMDQLQEKISAVLDPSGR
ncbi:hypothetical protein DSCO28_27710 [Desulfosarcina ovata subsp. sediminis]|uniref:histidine kinase n=1 Tax=Desulfosarcina ovata subsp. sediminis TaxID=885957 RepID=A0A5K7ZNP5_9BACT|nr:PAS domain-containing sensor histidine kinase [Desulfosarcina ovata]BBO82205.1 hypothetical protein DSCO28_27710 [Desulfosarcina ovata subsp. sediminis]